MARHPDAGAFVRTIGAMNAVGTLWIAALMVGINADIVGRELFGAPIRGVTELVSLSIVGIVFLQLPHALHAGRLTRNDALLRRLSERHPVWVGRLETAWALLGAALFAALAAAGVAPVAKALRVGEYVGALGDFTAPTWPIRALIVVGSAATAGSFLLTLWRRR